MKSSLVLASLLVSGLVVRADPLAKEVIRAMDQVVMDHTEWDNWEEWSKIMGMFFTQDMIYDTNWSPDDTMNNSTGLWEWFNNENVPWNTAFDNNVTIFNQLIFAAEETTATTTTYANSLWKDTFCTMEPSEPGMAVTVRIFDFYLMRGDHIRYNWMIIDTVDLMLQAGHRVLPKSNLREGFVRPPNSMDGIPAPVSRITSMEDAAVAKVIVESVLFYDLTGNPEAGVASPYWDDDMTWYGPVGFGMATNKREYEETFLSAVRGAITERELQVDILTCEGTYCGAHGYIHGNNTGDFLGEKASNKQVRLRFGLHFRVDTARGMIPEGYAIFDLPGFFIQNGINLYERMYDPAYNL